LGAVPRVGTRFRGLLQYHTTNAYHFVLAIVCICHPYIINIKKGNPETRKNLLTILENSREKLYTIQNMKKLPWRGKFPRIMGNDASLPRITGKFSLQRICSSIPGEICPISGTL
jgi:hypothetical protein